MLTPTWKFIVLLLVTTIFIFISRSSILKPRSHGFYGFFAWEAILYLFLLNVSFWLVKPLGWHQLISWAFLTLSIIPLIWGILLLKTQGQPTTIRQEDQALLSFEKTTSLVKVGIYKYIRHPLYASLLLLAWGIFFKHLSWMGAILALVSTLFLYLTALAEEEEMRRFFGIDYESYLQETKRFIPFLF